jgi:hypothetical protein
MAYMCGMLNINQVDPSLKADLETILRAVPSYLDIVLEETVKLVGEFKNR